MNLVFLSSSTGWGGLEQNLLRYARWMLESGHDITIMTVDGTPLHHQAAARHLPITLIHRQQRHLPWRAALKLRKRLIARQTDFIWIRDPRDLPLVSLAVSRLTCRLIFQQGMQIDRPKKKPWHRWRFAKIDHWVTPLKILEAEALQNTPLKPHQIVRIPLALEPEWFELSEEQSVARKKLGIANGIRVVGCFGRLDPLKGQDMLLQALETAVDWHALIIGENTANTEQNWGLELRAQAKSRGLEDRVHWHGQMDSLHTAYAACDVYAMCSVSETFGMVTLEALASGLPVIGTDSGGTSELLGHGNQGALIPSGDSVALAHALQYHQNIPRPSKQDLISYHKSAAVESWLKLLDGPARPAS